MKIGIFLGYGPHVKLNKEGLGRYLGGLVKGFQEQNHQVTIACPFWLKDTLDDLLETFFIDKNNIAIITTKNNPPLWNIYKFLTKKPNTSGIITRFLKFVDWIENNLLLKLASAQTGSAFLFWFLGIIFVLVAGSIPAALVSVFSIIKRLIKVFQLQIGKKIVNITGISSRLFDNINKVNIKKGAANIKNIPLLLFNHMNKTVVSSLVNIINSKTQEDVWFVPAIFWPDVTNINGVVVINAPDMVSQEFPQGFADVYNADQSIKECRKTITNGRYFITYCEYLRKSLLTEQYSKNLKNTVAIKHANNNMKPYIEIDGKLNKQLFSNNDCADIFSKDLVQKFAGREVKYIFYASQLRPNKNMLNLIKAYEYLLREKFIGYKLYVTADLKSNSLIYKYIDEHYLENDVISIFNVPAQTLAALYHCADLVVNPTIYEGGFPFTFSEGMSVGTPSIMSDIPQVREVLEKVDLEEIIFDPYDWRSIADKIEWALSDLEGLYKKELTLYREMEKRTYSVVAAEYVQAFEKFIDQSKVEEKYNE